MEMKMELMDWKDIERGAKNQLHSSNQQRTIALILERAAKAAIKKLGGKTLEEEDAEIKKNTATT